MTGHLRPPAVTLVRVRQAASQPGDATYLAVYSADAVETLATLGTEPDIAETMPWSALPGMAEPAAIHLQDLGPKSGLLIGSTEDGKWATWYPPYPAPPAP